MTIDLRLGDCLEVMPTLPDHSIDAIIADLPYGTTACSWDVVIPFVPLWAEYKRLIKPRGAIVLFGSQPFTSLLVTSNLEWFKYPLVWDKKLPTGHLDANRKPLKRHEDILIFCQGGSTYNPQMQTRGSPRWKGGKTTWAAGETVYHGFTQTKTHNNVYFPTTILPFSNADRNTDHPTQKPVTLLEYLIRTYSNEGETVLDNTMGSGTTIVACVNTGRNGIGIELREDYFAIAQRRVAEAEAQPFLLLPEAIEQPSIQVALPLSVDAT